jgi:hypothetical protein
MSMLVFALAIAGIAMSYWYTKREKGTEEEDEIEY